MLRRRTAASLGAILLATVLPGVAASLFSSGTAEAGAATSTVQLSQQSGAQNVLRVQFDGGEKYTYNVNGITTTAELNWNASLTVTKGKNGWVYGAGGMTQTPSVSGSGTYSLSGFVSGQPSCSGTIAIAPSKEDQSVSLALSQVQHQPGFLLVLAIPDASPFATFSGQDRCSFPSGMEIQPPNWTNPLVARASRPFSAPNFVEPRTASYDQNDMTYSAHATLTVSNKPLCQGDWGKEPATDACYVALGDSFSAGGEPPYTANNTGTCYRSQTAYPLRYDENASFWACGGSTVADVKSSQLPHVQRQTRLVTITVGGNDTGLFDLLYKCGALHITNIKCKGLLHTDVTASQLKSRLSSLYKSIKDRAPKAKILVLGYPNPLPAKLPKGCRELELPPPLQFFGLSAANVTWFHDLVNDLDSTVDAATIQSGVARYVAPEGFEEHDVCAGTPWFWPLQNGHQMYVPLPPNAHDNWMVSLHPNYAGQRQMADLVSKAYGPPHD